MFSKNLEYRSSAGDTTVHRLGRAKMAYESKVSSKMRSAVCCKVRSLCGMMDREILEQERAKIGKLPA